MKGNYSKKKKNYNENSVERCFIDLNISTLLELTDKQRWDFLLTVYFTRNTMSIIHIFQHT